MKLYLRHCHPGWRVSAGPGPMNTEACNLGHAAFMGPGLAAARQTGMTDGEGENE
jgi:hypothetical protein